MGLWDIVSGNTLRFNQMKDTAGTKVRRSLQTFVTSRLPDYPNSERMFVATRNHLFAYYFGAQIYVNNHLNGELKDYRSVLMGMNANTYLHFLSWFHAGDVVATYLAFADQPAAQGRLYLELEGVSEMYGRSHQFFKEWLSRLEFITESDDSVGARLAFQVFDGVAPLLGLSQNDAIKCMFWAEIGSEFSSYMTQCEEQPGWDEGAAGEIFAV